MHHSNTGYCNNKNACKFIHDSRRVVLCRKFLKGECPDDKCLLSHDKNKMPVCSMFLRGTCTRDDCRFRHVKVNGLAEVCPAFLSGYCPEGAACKLKHENAPRKPSPRSVQVQSPPQTASMTGTSILPPAVIVAAASTVSNDEGADCQVEPADTLAGIRPNIRFAPRHPNALPSLLSLHKKM